MAVKQEYFAPGATTISSHAQRMPFSFWNFAAEKLAQFRGSAGGRVGYLAGLKRSDAGVLDRLPRVEIRFSGAHAADIVALLFHLLGHCRDGKRADG